jgi:predicted nucleic acid-binding Zn ribbon protein
MSNESTAKRNIMIIGGTIIALIIIIVLIANFTA